MLNRIQRWVFVAGFLACLHSLAFAATVNVDMINVLFVPRDVTVNVGDTVTWVNRERTTHDTVSGTAGVPDGIWDSNATFGRLMRQGEAFSFTFNSAGTFAYYCTPHWDTFGMVGSVVVQNANIPPTVSITNLTSGQTFIEPANITIRADASDNDGTISKVDFFVNGTLIGSDTVAPYDAITNGLVAGTYTLRAEATDNAGATTSASINITVDPAPQGQPPTITSQPASQTVNPGANATFSVSASGDPPLTYQWNFNNVAIPGATDFTLVLTNVSSANAGDYQVIVANNFGSVTSVVAVLTVSGGICVFALSTSNATFTASGGSNTVAVTTQATCSWTVVNSNSWITILSGNGGTGSGVVTYRVLTNSAQAVRSGTLIIAGNTYSITQAGVKPSSNTDVNNDGQDDFVWRNTSGQLAVWVMNGVNSVSSMFLRNGIAVGLSWKLVGFADFNKDGKMDFLWQNVYGNLAIWFMDGTTFLSGQTLSNAPAVGSAWGVCAVDDFNKDGSADILFRHLDGYLQIWIMNGTSFVSRSLLLGGAPVPTGWRVVGSSDFTGDGQPDILWQRYDNVFALWIMAGINPSRGIILSNLSGVSTYWKTVGLTDCNQDGQTDLIWRNANGQFAVWFMNGTNRTGTSLINGGTAVSSSWLFMGPK